MQPIKLLTVSLLLCTTIFGQELCPPTFVDAYFFDEEVLLDWHQIFDYGDLLYGECFSSCSLAINAMVIDHVDDNSQGGWFRNTVGDTIDCGSGMFPCEDGGDDHFSAYAMYTGSDTISVDSRLITSSIDLTSYTTAYIEYIETYDWSIDVNDSNMVEVSTDSGVTWNVVHASIPEDVAEDIWFVTVDISEFAGNEILVAFRYYDSMGYGEAWYVDNIKVWGGQTGAENICGTFQNYNIYMDGALIGTSAVESYTAIGLENGTEYCFQVTAVYEEGESVSSAEVCSTPMGPFQVNPTSFNFEPLAMGEYQQDTLILQNYDTLDADFEITSIELSNVDAAMDLLVDNMEGSFSGFSDLEGWLGLWGIGDSISASSTYTSFIVPDDGGQFAFLNDDVFGAGADPVDSWLVSDEIQVDGWFPVFLLEDIFFPDTDGPCWTNNLYSDDLLIHVSVEDDTSWILIDSTLYTGWNWQSYIYNLTPNIGDATSFKVAFQYHDCDGNWGYGVALDNIAIKEGDDFTWITVSPYSGTLDNLGGINDSANIVVGVYGPYAGFSATDELIVASGELEITVQVGVGAQVSIEEPGITPLQFALHQNYPNPFNPETMIRFDVAEKTDLSISVYNILGEKVTTLLNGNLEAGTYHVQWNGVSDQGKTLPSGMYFYELNSPLFHSVKKLVLVK